LNWIEFYTYKNYIARYTLVGDRILERIQLKQEADAFLKKYETETKAYQIEIDRLTQELKLKEALLEAYARGNKQ